LLCHDRDAAALWRPMIRWPGNMEMHERLCVGVVCLVVLFTHQASAQDKSHVEAGAALYQDKCSECHGEGLVNPGSSFDLKKLGADERPRFNTSVMDGKGQMPAWDGQLTDADLDNLWAYIRSKADN
jgi:cytochrome c6